MNLSDKAKTFPKQAGVYLFKSASGEVLYVGKAKVLRNRIRNYFSKHRDDRRQIEFLIKRTHDIEYKEALLLENTLIKEHRPKYNFELRDDKTYVSIRLGTEKKFAGISIVRRSVKDGASYFGPYESSVSAREAVDQITRFFRVRSCKDREFANRVRPCLKFDIGRCTGPCVGKITEEKYAEQIKDAEMFLSGKSNDLIRILKEKMIIASENMQYEDAGRFRDAISKLKEISEKQKVVKHGGGDFDVVGLAREGASLAFCLMRVRKGLLLSKNNFFSKSVASENSDAISGFVLQKYKERSDCPPVLLLPEKINLREHVESQVAESAKVKMKILIPSRGDKAGLVQLACKNATEYLKTKIKTLRDEAVLDVIAEKLGLKSAPSRIECVDISNLQGKEAVGSVVSFVGTEPDKSGYRIYNINSISTPDDYEMMKEVITRRFVESVSRALPDLLMIDGGKGHLAVVKRVLDEFTLDLPVISIAKAKSREDCDKIFLPNRSNPVNFKKGSPELLFFQRIRDEAHRFGITAHRKRRIKSMTS